MLTFVLLKTCPMFSNFIYPYFSKNAKKEWYDTFMILVTWLSFMIINFCKRTKSD